MIRLYPHKKYKIKWVDILSFPEWKSKEDILKIHLPEIEAVYMYVGRGSGDALCFAGEYNGGEYGNVSLIPKGCIKKITLIK